jgi:Na+/proline symporter
VIALATILYLVAVLAIGATAARRTRTKEEFWVAGRRLSLVVTALATLSSAFSGFVFVGGPGLAYRLGIGSLWIVLPIGFTSGLLVWVVGARLRALGAVREAFTVPDAIAERWRSPGVTALAAIAVLCGSIVYLGLQVQAAGVVLQAIFGLSSPFGAMLLAAAVLATYCTLGGMVAGVHTDVLQGTLMAIVGVVVFASALAASGGLGAMADAVRGAPAFGPTFLEPLGRLSAQAAFATFFVFGIGVLGQPHVLHKFYMLRDPRQMRYLPVVVASGQVLSVLLWCGVGLAVPALVARGALAPLARPDDAAPAFLLGFAPEVVAGLAFACILAAITSNADSLVNVASAAVVRDLPRVLGRPLVNEVAWGRAATVGVTALALGVAYGYGGLIAILGTFAFGLFGASLAPVMALGLHWRRATPRAAGASIVMGLVATLALELASRTSRLPGSFHPGATALALSFATLVVVTALTRNDPRREPDPDVARALGLEQGVGRHGLVP